MSKHAEQLPHVVREAMWILDTYTAVDVIGVRGSDPLNEWRNVLGGFLHHQRREFRDGVMLTLNAAARSVITMYAAYSLPPEILADRIIGGEVAELAETLFGKPSWLRVARFSLAYPLKSPKVMAALHASQPFYERTLDGDPTVSQAEIIAAVRYAIGEYDGWSVGGRLGKVLRQQEGGR